MKRAYSYLLRGLTLIHFFAVGNYILYAQASDNATLNVALSDVRSIMVNPTQNTVELVFATPEDYQNGVTSSQSSHIMVTSTGGFQITVKASTEGLVNGTYSIPVNTIGLRPGPGAKGSILLAIIYYDLNLSSARQPVIESPGGCHFCAFDVVYHAKGGDPYIGKPAGTYVGTITYSIEPN